MAVAAASRSMLIVALAIAPEASAQPVSPLLDCENKSWPTNGLNGYGHAYKVDDARRCLDGIRISLHEMLVTLENMYFGHSSIYSFTDIVKNTTASVETNKCNLKVHDVSVDLEGGIAQIFQDLVHPELLRQGLTESFVGLEDLTSSSLHEKLTSPSEVSALDFHGRLHGLLAGLQDAHTLYVTNTRILQALPVQFKMAPCVQSGNSTFQFTAEPSTVGRNLDVGGVNSRALSRESARVVARINGEEPIDYLQRIADNLGTVHDKGQRLNKLLLGDSAPGCDGLCFVVGFHMDIIEPGGEAVFIEFADGVTETVDWVLAFDGDVAYEALTSPNADYVTLQKMEVAKANWKEERAQACAQIPACDAAAFLRDQFTFPMSASRAYRRVLSTRVSDRILHEAALLAASKASEVSPSSLARSTFKEPSDTRRLMVQVVEPELATGQCNLAKSTLPVGAQFVQGCCVGQFQMTTMSFSGTEFVTASIVGDMAVFKLTSMGSTAADVNHATIAWAKLSEASRNAGIKRVLIDLIGNGGGIVSLSDLLQSLFLKEYDPQKLCSWYNKRVPQYWAEWAKSFGRGLDASVQENFEKVRQIASNHTVDVVRWYAYFHFRYLRGILAASNEILGKAFGCDSLPHWLFRLVNPSAARLCRNDITVDLEMIDGWIRDINSSSTAEEILAVAESALTERRFVPRILLGRGEVGWFPFEGDEVLDPATMRPYPNLSGILEPESQHWGGVESNYSKRGIFAACKVASDDGLASMQQGGLLSEEAAALLRQFRDHPWEQIAFVTDGNAGSAGSSLPSKLMASGYAAAFTFGGGADVSGMDTSGFAGGNVLEYGGWWSKVAVAAELGMWLLPNSAWERYSRMENATMISDPSQPFYPYPMPTTARARFNFNMMYTREMSEDTSLPRQFYRMPAHRHFHQWPRGLHTTCENVGDLYSLYRAIHDEDWWAVRTTPVHADGWGGDCLPDMSQQCLPPGCSGAPHRSADPFPGDPFPSPAVCGAHASSVPVAPDVWV